MGTTKEQKEKQTVFVPTKSCTESTSSSSSSSHGTYKYSSLHLFLQRAPPFLLSLVISLSALFCFLSYGWLTLIYFFRLLFTKEVEERGDSEGVFKAFVCQEIEIDELNGDYCSETNIESSDRELEEKEIIEIEKSEAPFEEKILFVDENTEDLLKPEGKVPSNTELSDEEIEEKEIIEIEKMEAPFEEKILSDGEKTEDLLKSEEKVPSFLFFYSI